LAPLCDTVPFHEPLMVWPLAKVQVSDQLVHAIVPVFSILMVAPNWLEFCGEIV
jgi:hypothetical protein